MGNASVKGDKQLYFDAMANVTQIERKELGALRKGFQEAGRASGGNPLRIARDDFGRVVDACAIAPQDVEILERLFTMFDKMGEQPGRGTDTSFETRVLCVHRGAGVFL